MQFVSVCVDNCPLVLIDSSIKLSAETRPWALFSFSWLFKLTTGLFQSTQRIPPGRTASHVTSPAMERGWRSRQHDRVANVDYTGFHVCIHVPKLILYNYFLSSFSQT